MHKLIAQIKTFENVKIINILIHIEYLNISMTITVALQNTI